ncbi:T-complex protein 1, beta subunit [Pneumocystis murina B123]|uniref:CCT-beta n=1 Tax=Pneumocystis murina (strain B123) TaxID=1069680 RepID=M7NRW9_PNEMU|nr:T-complex protein 1, beta subunit [Pneumocystis murina B123]EMR11498.1 T-complex protein 1, beta subunit [Pneumocystis murina B123]
MSRIFSEHATEERGENARMSSFVGAIAVGDLVKSTLGPKGMDKILQSASTGEIIVTNDGATILKSIELDNAAAKALVNVSMTQDNEVGDGTTSVTVLAAELLREAERLIDSKIHPQIIIDGYRIAATTALSALCESAVDHKENYELFRRDLEDIARTTLSSKILAQDRDHFSKLAVDAVLRLKSTNLESIQIIKKSGGRLRDSYLDDGFILEKKIGVNQPKRLENAKILVSNTPMDTDKVKVFGARVRVDATSKLAELERAEREKMKAKVEKIKAHGVNCFVNRQLIYNWPEQLFADAGMMSIEHADFDGIERLALVTGGEIASTFDHPEYVKLGRCDLIEEIIIGEDRMIKFSGVAVGEACTIVLRGATSQLLDEAERSLHDALAVLSQTMGDSKVVLGGGCSEILMAKAVDAAASKESGKKAFALEAFGRALRMIPTILASNAGLDSSELISKLRSVHYKGMTSYGLDLINGEIADMRDAGVVESYKLKRSIVSNASEVVEMLLRVDTILRSTPRPRTR